MISQTTTTTISPRTTQPMVFSFGSGDLAAQAISPATSHEGRR
jgi:hypothetical protein